MTDSRVTLWSSTRSEWIKFRSVRSTIMGFAVTIVLTLGIGALVTSAVRSHWTTMDPIEKLAFDPVAVSLAGTLFAQFAVGVIGTLFITSEYSSGSIRTSLAAVPQRWRLVAGKLLVLTTSILLVSELVCVVTFLMGQAIFAGHVPTASLGHGAVLRAVLLAGVYLTLLAALGFGLGLTLRHSAGCISTFASLLLIFPIVVFLLPQGWQDAVTKFEPSMLGRSMMSASTPNHAFAVGTATFILLGYVTAVLGVGVAVLHQRDA